MILGYVRPTEFLLLYYEQQNMEINLSTRSYRDIYIDHNL